MITCAPHAAHQDHFVHAGRVDQAAHKFQSLLEPLGKWQAHPVVQNIATRGDARTTRCHISTIGIGRLHPNAALVSNSIVAAISHKSEGHNVAHGRPNANSVHRSACKGNGTNQDAVVFEHTTQFAEDASVSQRAR